MNRQDQQARQKAQAAQQQRTVRRNQIILVVFSGILILSMILSLIVNL